MLILLMMKVQRILHMIMLRYLHYLRCSLNHKLVVKVMFTPIGKEEADVQHLANGGQIIQIWLSIPLQIKHHLRASDCVQPTEATLVIHWVCTLVAVSTTTALPLRFRSPRLFASHKSKIGADNVLPHTRKGIIEWQLM